MSREATRDQNGPLRSPTNIWCICLGKQALSNVEIARENQVWGAMEEKALAEIARGDHIVFAVGLTSQGGPDARGFPRLDSQTFPKVVAEAKQVFLVRAATGIHHDESPLWSDDSYPWRFRFQELGSARDVSIPDAFSQEQIEVLRLCAIQGGTARPLPGRIESLKGVLDSLGQTQDNATDGEHLLLKDDVSPETTQTNPSGAPELPLQDRMDNLVDYVASQGFVFEPWQIAAYVTALRTKPFVILAGVSGTGKSQLPQLVAEATEAECQLVAVRPNWTDSSDVLGYQDLRGRFRPGPLLQFARQATKNPDVQHVFIIDEMNLAHVEYYLAEVLSRMEDRRLLGEKGYVTRPLLDLDLADADTHWVEQGLPSNLAIVGTVNMDETTHSFSRKVLDRAFTLEFSTIYLADWRPDEDDEPAVPIRWPASSWFSRAIQLADLDGLSDQEYGQVAAVVDTLTDLNRFLVQAQLQVGYRTRDEAALFVLHARKLSSSFVTMDGEKVDPLDLVLHMKVLPRIVGGSNAIRRLLLQVLGWASEGDPFEEDHEAHAVLERWNKQDRSPMLSDATFPQTAARLCLMWDRLQSEGFTSFWL